MSPTLPIALLLDLDDTILSDSARVDECWMYGIDLCATMLGAEEKRRVMQEIVAARTWFWGDSSRHRSGRLDLLETRRHIVREALVRIGMPDPALGNAIGDAYSRRRDELLELFPGAVETIATIRAHGTRLALITNGMADMQRGKINRFNLAKYFDAIVVEGEFGVGKPDEAVFRHALSTLDVKPSDAWMVGDNLEWDVAGPQRLGIKGLWMDVKGTGLPATTTVRPDRIIRSLTDLLSDA